MLKKNILVWLGLLILVSCSVEGEQQTTEPNDARFVGRWVTAFSANSLVVVNCSSDTYETLVFALNSSASYDLTNDSSKGSYVGLNGTFTPDDEYSYFYEAHNWLIASNANEPSTYTFLGSGVGSVLTISNTNEVIVLTNEAAYVTNPNMNGLWSNYMSGGIATNTIMLLEVSGGTSFTMTEMKSTIAYTNVIKEITTGTATFNSATTNGWMESRITTQQEWLSEGGSLGSVTTVFNMSRMSFVITNAGTNLVANGAVFTKVNP